MERWAQRRARSAGSWLALGLVAVLATTLPAVPAGAGTEGPTTPGSAAATATVLDETPIEPLTANGCHTWDKVRRRRVCIHVVGSGLRVDDISADWDAIVPLCNTQIRIAYFDTSNRNYRNRTSSVRSGCSQFFGSFHPNIGAFETVRTGRICGSVIESGVQRSGACVNVFS
jgi:hypothetical protein